MTKLQAVIDWIVAHGEGYTINQRNTDDMVLSLDVSPSTIRRAVRQLRQKHVMTKNTYTPHSYVNIEQLVSLMGDEFGTLMTDAFFEIAMRDLHATRYAVEKSIQYAIGAGLLVRVAGGMALRRRVAK